MYVTYIRYISYISITGLITSCIFCLFLALFIPSTFNPYANKDINYQYIDNHETLSELKETTKLIINANSKSQKVSMLLFRLSLLFLLFTILLFFIALFYIRKMKGLINEDSKWAELKGS